MAQKALLENFLSCPVCLETLRDPVSLSCNHSVCLSCLQQFWEKAENKNCPACRKESSQDPLLVNFALKELADSFVEIHDGCSEHQEEPRLFCKDEERAVCSVCDFPLHHDHNVIPREQDVSDMKEQLRSDLKPLQDKRDKNRGAKKTYDKMIQVCKKQMLFAEKQIRAEFKELHQFLREEEKSRLAALRKEEEQKVKTISREMKKIQEHVSSLADSISAVKKDLHKDHVSFLSSYKSTQTRARALCSVPDPQLVSGALIDVAQHLGNLSFRVWEKMKEKVHFTPVILDPNSAYQWLHLSDDLTGLRCGDTCQHLPDNPERNTIHPTVLGSEGFSSGKHSWEVVVGDLPGWNIGLMRRSADRKRKIFTSPANGIWSLWHGSGKYITSAGLTVELKKRLQRLRVQLDYDGGEVSFYDAEDMTRIYTHKDTFTGTLLPYFSVSLTGDAGTTDLKICPTEVSLSY